jgi:hypothetical protein
VIIGLEEFADQEALQPVLDRFHAAEQRVPWLDNRLLVLSLPPPAPDRDFLNGIETV